MLQVMPHFSKLTNGGILTDVQAGLAALRADPRVDPARISVIGFCVGGLATFLAAAHTDAAAFEAFYGGGLDQSIPAEDVAAIDTTLTSLGKTHQTVTLPEGGHGFACDDRAAFHQPSNDDAWRITYEWPEANL